MVISPQLNQAFRRERASLFVQSRDSGRTVECKQRAAQALRDARIRVAWEALDGYTTDHWHAPASPDHLEPGRVRLVQRPDDHSPADDFDGSEFDKERERARARMEGMWGIESQFWNGAQWVDVDSVWGFIGRDWDRSGYDTDLMSAVLQALAAHHAAQAREIEESRPDLYTLH